MSARVVRMRRLQSCDSMKASCVTARLENAWTAFRKRRLFANVYHIVQCCIIHLYAQFSRASQTFVLLESSSQISSDIAPLLQLVYTPCIPWTSCSLSRKRSLNSFAAPSSSSGTLVSSFGS